VAAVGLSLGLAVPILGQEEDNAVFHYSHLEIDGTRRDGATLGRWNANGWIGTDFDRLWWNSKAEIVGTNLEKVEITALYGQYVRRFWDVVVGYRQDVRPEPQGYLVVGLMGLAPYWFEVGLFGYLSDHGRPSVRLDAENDLFLTQRVVLTLEGGFDLLLTPDEELDLGAGISEAELGVRTRFEIQRKFAPYVGLTWLHEKSPRVPATEEVRIDGFRIDLGLRLIY
jgi:copper resistance protein B